MFRPINIRAVANGWVVQCGCQELVYTGAAALMADLFVYLTDPDGTEKRVLATAINVRHTMDPPAAPPRTHTNPYTEPYMETNRPPTDAARAAFVAHVAAVERFDRDSPVSEMPHTSAETRRIPNER